MVRRRDSRRAWREEVALESAGDDLQLIQRLVLREPAAWTTFVERYQRLVFTRVLVVVREFGRMPDSAVIDDLCAEVFSQLVARDFSVLRRFEGRSRFSTWLCVVVRRICVRRLCNDQRDPVRQAGQDDGQLHCLGGTASDPLRDLIQAETRERLQAGLRHLNDKQQAMVRLFYMDGCSYREISEQLGIPMNSIGPTMQRVHQKLREVMKVDES